MVLSSNDTGCFGASIDLGQHHAKQELYIIPVDYHNKNNKKEERESSRQKAEAELHGERKILTEKKGQK